jgi:UDP-N-acetyl-D-mannosaminuronate dehydrogenase
MALYSQAIDMLVPVSSCRVAEATKLLENIFRSVSIALVNELKTVYAAMGTHIWEVIEAAKTKPFGFMPFYPGPGRLSGHCVPIDPFFPSPDYDSKHWWRYSDGVREGIGESIAYIYARFFFYPSPIEANVN